jgi:hypothetical protein
LTRGPRAAVERRRAPRAKPSISQGSGWPCFRPERYKGLALYDDSLRAVPQAVAGSGLFAAVHGVRRADAELRHRPPRQLFFSHMICHPFEQMAAVSIS